MNMLFFINKSSIELSRANEMSEFSGSSIFCLMPVNMTPSHHFLNFSFIITRLLSNNSLLHYSFNCFSILKAKAFISQMCRKSTSSSSENRATAAARMSTCLPVPHSGSFNFRSGMERKPLLKALEAKAGHFPFRQLAAITGQPQLAPHSREKHRHRSWKSALLYFFHIINVP